MILLVARTGLRREIQHRRRGGVQAGGGRGDAEDRERARDVSHHVARHRNHHRILHCHDPHRHHRAQSQDRCGHRRV